MSRAMAERMLERWYGDAQHPYRLFEECVDALLAGGEKVLLDAGCGRTAPVLRTFVGACLAPHWRRDRRVHRCALWHRDAQSRSRPPAAGECPRRRDHVARRIRAPDGPQSTYREFERVLRPRGWVMFLTANLWDFGTLIARIIPNRFHGRIVKAVEGRAEEDTFPTAYKTNTQRDIKRLAAASGLEIESFEFLSQYPNYLMFSGPLFALGTAFEKLISRFDALRFLRGWIMVTLVKPAYPK